MATPLPNYAADGEQQSIILDGPAAEGGIEIRISPGEVHHSTARGTVERGFGTQGPENGIQGFSFALSTADSSEGPTGRQRVVRLGFEGGSNIYESIAAGGNRTARSKLRTVPALNIGYLCLNFHVY